MPEDAAFCNKCGGKMATKMAQQPSTNSTLEMKQKANESKPTTPLTKPDNVTSVVNNAKSVTKPKNVWKKIVLIIVAANVFLGIIVAIVINIMPDDEPDLIRVALSVSPMSEHGFDATYDDMFNWLMRDRISSINPQGGGVAHLEFSGTVTGGEYDVTIVIVMTGLAENTEGIRVIPYAMVLNGVDVPDFNNHAGILMDLFWAHHNRSDYRTFMDFVRWDNK